MKPWMEEVVSALGAAESHSQPFMAALLSLSLGIALLTPLSLVHANGALFGPEGSSPFILCFFLAVAVVANAVSWRPSQSFSALNRPAWGIAWCLALAACTASLPIVVWSGMSNALVVAMIALIAGVSFTFVMLYLGHLFTRTYIPDIVKRSFAASAVAVLFTAVVFPRLPYPANYFIIAGLNALNTPLIVVLLRNAPAIGDYTSFLSFHDRRNEAGLFIAKVALPLVCAGTVICLFQTNCTAVARDLPAPTLADDLSTVVYLVVEYIILSFTVYGVRRFAWPFAQLHSFIIPLVGLLGSICVGTSMGSAGGYDGGTVAIYAMFMALTWSFMGGASLEYLLRSASVFGMGLGCMALGIIIGCGLNQLQLFGSAPGSILAAFICLLMAVGFLPPRPAPNLSHSTYSTVLRSVVGPSTVGPSGDEDIEAEAEPAEAENPLRQGPETSARRAGTAEAQPGRQAKGRFMRCCDHVAKTFLLSARETEVLYLLAKGRSMSHIMEELVISEGTAKTHINHVYKKLDVHSRHELVNLIESIRVEDVDL